MAGRIQWRRRTIVIAALAACAAGAAADPRAQSVTGVVPKWADLETWARPIAATSEVEHGLGLQFGGTGGMMMLSFSGRISTRTSAPPTSIGAVVAPPVLANPNVIRKASLTFIADDGTDLRAVIDVSSSLRVDDPAPGAVIRSASVQIPAADFARLTKAKTLKVTVFGSDSLVRIDQIKAMQSLADKLKVSR